MKNIQIILNAVLSKNIIEYILIDKNFTVVSNSEDVHKYLEKKLNVGDDILSVLPEFVGAEDNIRKIFSEPKLSYEVESVYKNNYYVNMAVEHYGEEIALILLHNITDTTLSKQKLLQYSNESILLNNTLKKILDSQDTLLFVTNKDEITYINEQFMEYFSVKRVSELKRRKLKLYKSIDSDLEDYDALFERVNSKEEYVIIDNDTFILQASCIEATHRLFTLTKVTRLRHNKQIDTLTCG